MASAYGAEETTIYRTPVGARVAVIGALAADIAIIEVILQTMVVIPPLLQGLIVLLLAGLGAIVTVLCTGLVTVTAGPDWIAAHRLSWRRVTADELVTVSVFGTSPSRCSIWLGSKAGERVRLGVLAVRSSAVRAHVRALVEAAAQLGRVQVPSAASEVLDLDVPTSTDSAIPPKARFVRAAITSGIVFGLGMRYGLHDDWATAVALGCAASLTTAGFYWWVVGPLYWAGRY